MKPDGMHTIELGLHDHARLRTGGRSGPRQSVNGCQVGDTVVAATDYHGSRAHVQARVEASGDPERPYVLVNSQLFPKSGGSGEEA